MRTPYTIEDCKRFAAERGGRCLSRSYVDVTSKLEWRCAAGHRWRTSWGRVHGLGRWCPVCTHQSPYTIQDMRAIAAERGGECLSKTYTNGEDRLLWRCEHGHTWQAQARSVRRGTWCPACAERVPWTFEQIARLARERGGQCLKSMPVPGTYRWRCSARHEWTAPLSSVIEGTWCGACAGNKRLTLGDLRQTARQRGGRCLADTYLGSAVKVEWECAEGHRWMARPSQIRAGSWCPPCANEKKRRVPSRRLDLSDMRKTAAERGGKCLSEEYWTTRAKLKWQCREGHVWWAQAGLVRHGSWCPHCAGVASPTMDELRKAASQLGGECLSDRYLGTHKHLRWRCGEGHEFLASPLSVKKGRFCPECRPRKPGTLAEMKALADARGGKCLSKSYLNRYTHLEWSCARGHRWRAVPYSIKRGSWCPECARGHD